MDRPLARGGHVRVRAAEQSGRGVQHRHPAADRLRVVARGPRVLLHPHRPGRPLPADDRETRVLPDRLGRQRPTHRAPGAELLRRALRPDRGVRPRLHATREARPEEPPADQPPQLRGLVPRADPRRREGVRGPVAAGRAQRGLDHPLYDHFRRLDRGGPARVPAQRHPRRGVPRRGSDAVGRDVPDRGRPSRAGGARLPRRVPPGRLLADRRRGPGLHRDHPAGTDRGLRRADRPPGRRALRASCSGVRSAPLSTGSSCRSWPTRPPSRTRVRASRCAAPSAT